MGLGFGLFLVFVMYVLLWKRLRGKKYGVGNVGKESTLMIEIVEKVECIV